MNYYQAIDIAQKQLLPIFVKRYGLEGYEIEPVAAHHGGRNLIYTCEKPGEPAKILRISYLEDRTQEDFLAELEYVRFLRENGASVAEVLDSVDGTLLEEVACQGHVFFAALFERAKGKMLVENNYQYQEGAPLTEYFYNCGKVLGRIHQLSKEYRPVHRRESFFDWFHMGVIDRLVPDSLPVLKGKMALLLRELEALDRGADNFGMLHFDFNDGNYHIDFDTGQITVYDFDNACFGWYLYDLAELWVHGVGWVQLEPQAEKRREFMDEYFATVVAGYRSETVLADAALGNLPLLIQATVMETVLGEFEVMERDGEEPDLEDGELQYRIRCLEEGIPYVGFFHEMYSCEEPFTC